MNNNMPLLLDTLQYKPTLTSWVFGMVTHWTTQVRCSRPTRCGAGTRGRLQHQPVLLLVPCVQASLHRHPRVRLPLLDGWFVVGDSEIERVELRSSLVGGDRRCFPPARASLPPGARPHRPQPSWRRPKVSTRAAPCLQWPNITVLARWCSCYTMLRLLSLSI